MGEYAGVDARIALLAATLAASTLAGCGRYGAQREVVVAFRPTATQAQHDAARQACLGIARTTAEPAPRSTLESSRRNDVRFRVDKANDSDLAKLYDCLRRQPGVIGISLPND